MRKQLNSFAQVTKSLQKIKLKGGFYPSSTPPCVRPWYKHFSFKGPPTFLISSASYLNFGVEAFFEWLSGDGTEFWAPVTAWALQLGLWSTADTALGGQPAVLCLV